MSEVSTAVGTAVFDQLVTHAVGQHDRRRCDHSDQRVAQQCQQLPRGQHRACRHPQPPVRSAARRTPPPVRRCNRHRARLTDVEGSHGKEKVYGSIP
jgi:hypothetical protein